MARKLPQEMRKFSKVLMAGEQVLLFEKPDTKKLILWEALVGVGVFVVLLAFIMMFGSLPIGLASGAAVVFSIAACGLLHFFFATTTYIVTDGRLMVVTDLGHELKDQCQFDEMSNVRKVKFANQLVVERANGKPIRLFALRDRDEVERVLIGE